MLYNDITKTIGDTPIVKVNNLDLDFDLYLKLEYFNPGGSLKDRIALNMILDLEEKGIIRKGSTIIEPTSGNTGIAIAMICASKGMNAILTMPSSMSKERQMLLKAYGAKVVLTDPKDGMSGAINKALELQKEIDGSVILQQFKNPNNPLAHKKTSLEIYNDLKPDVVISGIGTGGTATGIATYLKELLPNLKVFGVEPLESPIITKGFKGSHKIQGIGAGFIPDVLDLKNIDKVYTISSSEAYSGSKLIGVKEGILIGISAGASVSLALKLKDELKGKKVLVIAHDNAERYLSTDLYD